MAGAWSPWWARLRFFTYAVFPASFTAGTAMLTGVIVFLLHAVSPDTAQTALDRGIDTAIGGAIGLAAYCAVADLVGAVRGAAAGTLVDAQHVYLDAVLNGLTTGRRMSDARLRTLARQARVAFTDAQSGDRPGAQRTAPRRHRSGRRGARR